MSDRAAREAALDPSRSFIVQAPAGSGKTELLIQRYLTLLATVDEPEQVVAITFTRKAAAEMRNRVYRALRLAAEGEAVAHPHQAHTVTLARAALLRNDALGWSLLTQPRRMRVETLDALNARLARQLPTSSGGAAATGIAEDATELYRLAAQRTVEQLAGDDQIGRSVRILLRNFDNSVPRLESLLADLLPRRDQWLRRFATANEAELRQELELALRRLVGEELRRAAAMLPADLRLALSGLLAHASRHAVAAESRAVFDQWLQSSETDELALDALEAWRAVAQMLLTKQGQWRRKLDRSIGFGPAHPLERQRLQDVLDDLGGDLVLQDALSAARDLPEPRYSPEQWTTMASLRVVLRHLAAELRVVFAERQTVDFVELALAAQQALGRADAPSELLLALDKRIQHLLVDEFQDTSHSQLRLLELLTAGWESGDGRTLFLVGDPMQSIYRFRDADMSLFLKVQQSGIGSIQCRSLSLEQNFRSAPAVVDWVNETFLRAFPSEDDIGSGAAKFSPCTATRAAIDGAEVQVHAMRSGDHEDELAAAMEIIARERRRDSTQSIAVLVQSRTHLAGLHEHLRAQGIEVHAVEIDPLHEHQVVQDLIGLTRALTHLGDRVAWLAVLRAPWCGVGWRDLEALCIGSRDRTIWELLNDPTAVQRVGEDARERLRWITRSLADAFEVRAEHSFVDWIERTWMSLDGDAWLETDDDRRRAELFFITLEHIARRGDVEDPADLEAAFKKPYSQAQAPHNAGIEIMTIHRAKGLEFDTVILFGLGRAPRRDDQKALYWMERVAADGNEDLIMAPLPPMGQEDRLTDFVRRAEDARELAERTRLLYVAATRARERLHLVCHVERDTETPSPRTLLVHLWPQLAHLFDRGDEAAVSTFDDVQQGEQETAGQESVQPVLRRFADGFAQQPGVEPREPGRSAAGREMRPEFDWASAPAIQVGTLVHRYLQRIAMTGIEKWSDARVRSSLPAFRRELTLLGLEREEAEPAAQRVAEALQGVLDDPQGRWIFKAHSDARSEVRLTLNGGTVLEHVQLDRTFVDESGMRWIIDFKTGSHEGAGLDEFLDAEVERYRFQLHRYAETMAVIETRPIRVGLYFPLLKAFRSWRPFD